MSKSIKITSYKDKIKAVNELRELVVETGLNMSDFSNISGLSYSNLVQWCGGAHLPTTKNFATLKNVLKRREDILNTPKPVKIRTYIRKTPAITLEQRVVILEKQAKIDSIFYLAILILSIVNIIIVSVR